MGKGHSTGVTDELHERLMESVDERDRRRQDQLGRLPTAIGRTLRGRMREEYPVFSPWIFSRNMAENLQKRLTRKKEVLRDQFTKHLPTFRKKTEYVSYILAAERNNERVETDPEEQKQAELARLRQPRNVADRVHLSTWVEWQKARIYRAGIKHVRDSVAKGNEPHETALRISASAVEDLGFCLEDSPVLGKLSGHKMIPRKLIEIGQHAAVYPRTLLAQPPQILEIVQLEQERREELWGSNLARYENSDWGGSMRTSEDRAEEVVNDMLIDQLRVK